MNKTSVIIATYNGEKYLYEQLESIKNQTVRPDEVIITDDNSVDSTRQIVESFINENNLTNWKLIKNSKKNKGISENFINGIRNCSGEIIFLCDQDDVWKNNKIQKIIDCFDSNENLTCVISSVEYIDENDKQLNIKTVYSNNNSHYVDFAELLSVCSYLGMSAAFKSDIKRIMNLKLMKLSSHDWALFISAIEKGSILFVGDHLSCYRQHSSNNSFIRSSDKKEKRIQLLARQVSHIQSVIECEILIPYHFQMCINYIDFLKKRIFLISKKKWLHILLSYVEYKKRKYSNRSFLADIYAAL